MRAHICLHCRTPAPADTRCAADGCPVVEDRAGELIDARYRLRAPLGRGGMGSVVWSAEQLDTGQEVALKLLAARDADSEARFARGAIIASHLQHPGITKVHGQGRHTDGSLFMVMERLKGQDLRAALADGPLNAERVMRLIDQLLGALVHMHGQHVMHLDIKPGNLFAINDGHGEHIKLLDFDITNVTGAACAPLRARLPVPGTPHVCGTPQYMAPERLRGEAVDTRADLYAVGVVMYELLTGKLPFRDTEPQALQRQHHTSRPRTTPLRHVQPRLAAVVLRALRREPRTRFEDAGAMRRALRDTRRRTESKARAAMRRQALSKRAGDPDATTKPCRPIVSASGA